MSQLESIYTFHFSSKGKERLAVHLKNSIKYTNSFLTEFLSLGNRAQEIYR